MIRGFALAAIALGGLVACRPSPEVQGDVDAAATSAADAAMHAGTALAGAAGEAAGTAAAAGGTAAAMGGTIAAQGGTAVTALGTAVEYELDVAHTFAADVELRRLALVEAMDDLSAAVPEADVAELRETIEQVETELRALQGTAEPQRERLDALLQELERQAAALKARSPDVDLAPLEAALSKLRATVEATPEG